MASTSCSDAERRTLVLVGVLAERTGGERLLGAGAALQGIVTPSLPPIRVG
jgi:hypothetical protein